MTYVFDNGAPQAPERLTALAEVYDPSTIQHLIGCGVSAGWKCLEIGGGLGTIARWLSNRVGFCGYVLATDIDTRFLEVLQLPNLEVRRHDILVDPLPEQAFDVAHARLVLEHLPDPDTALERMIAALKPGGCLVVEDLELQSSNSNPDNPLDRVLKTTIALRRVATKAGVNATLGLSLADRLRAHGLIHVEHQGLVRVWRGGSAGARLARLNFEQLRDEILATGTLTMEEFEADLVRLQDEQFAWRSPILWTAWGKRPERVA
jgi:SAM-dependent methyltransferase